MKRAGMSWAGAVLLAALPLLAAGPAFAGGAGGPGDSLLGTLAGSQLSTRQMGSVRGGSGVTILDGTNTLVNSLDPTTNNLNDTASSSGSVNGFVGGGSMTGQVTGSVVTDNSGFVNVFTNTGNNVMMNSSTSIFISNAP